MCKHVILMKFRSLTLSVVLAAFLVPPTSSSAQDAESFQDMFLMHFGSSARKFVGLANAMPAEKYSWSPGVGTMSVERVFMHIARYNYQYPHENLGAELPEGIDLDTMEDITGKESVLAHLEESMAFVRKTVKLMGEAGMGKETRLYGRDMQGWGVYFQLIAHMNEHLGQSIAYARMNDVVPPWSR